MLKIVPKHPDNIETVFFFIIIIEENTNQYLQNSNAAVFVVTH